MQSIDRTMAGIDVHKKMLAVVIRRECGEQAESEKRKFGTTRCEIQSLHAWLEAHQVSEVVMESTAQYWRPVWMALESEFKLTLAQRAPHERDAAVSGTRPMPGESRSGCCLRI